MIQAQTPSTEILHSIKKSEESRKKRKRGRKGGKEGGRIVLFQLQINSQHCTFEIFLSLSRGEQKYKNKLKRKYLRILPKSTYLAIMNPQMENWIFQYPS